MELGAYWLLIMYPVGLCNASIEMDAGSFVHVKYVTKFIYDDRGMYVSDVVHNASVKSFMKHPRERKGWEVLIYGKNKENFIMSTCDI